MSPVVLNFDVNLYLKVPAPAAAFYKAIFGAAELRRRRNRQNNHLSFVLGFTDYNFILSDLDATSPWFSNGETGALLMITRSAALRDLGLAADVFNEVKTGDGGEFECRMNYGVGPTLGVPTSNVQELVNRAVTTVV